MADIMSIDAARVPPHDLEAEQALLGSMLLSRTAITAALELLTPNDFYRTSHRHIAETIQQLDHADGTIDAVTVLSAMRAAGHIKTSDDALYLHTLTNAVPTAANAAHYAQIVADHASRRHVIDAATRTIQAAYAGQTAEAALEPLTSLNGSHAAATAARKGNPGGDWIIDSPDHVPSLWGYEHEILWAQGQPLMITGPTGIGKTTLAQRVLLASLGIGNDEILSYPVAPNNRKALYIAADRPLQARISMRRMVDAADRQLLNERLTIHVGPLDYDIAKEPARFANWIQSLDVGIVVIDSLKDIAGDLTKDEGGGGVSRAIQLCIARGIEIIALHHHRKAHSENKKPKKIDDVYGSQLLTAGMGTVIVLWGQPGDPIIELNLVKQAGGADVGPFDLLVDHKAGSMTIDSETSDPLTILRQSNGISIHDLTAAVHDTSKPDRSDVHKMRRRLIQLEKDGLAHCQKAPVRSRTNPDLWFATSPQIDFQGGNE